MYYCCNYYYYYYYYYYDWYNADAQQPGKEILLE